MPIYYEHGLDLNFTKGTMESILKKSKHADLKKGLRLSLEPFDVSFNFPVSHLHSVEVPLFTFFP